MTNLTKIRVNIKKISFQKMEILFLFKYLKNNLSFRRT